MTTWIRLEHLDQDLPTEDLGIDDAKAALWSNLLAAGYPDDLAEAVAEEVAIDLVTPESLTRYETSTPGRRILLTSVTEPAEVLGVRRT